MYMYLLALATRRTCTCTCFFGAHHSIWCTPFVVAVAMTDRDEALHYLLNKLKSEDGWSSANLTWNDEKLAVISDQFSSFDGVVKAKVLLSFLSMSPRTITQVCGTHTCIHMYMYIVHCTCTHSHFYMYMYIYA